MNEKDSVISSVSVFPDARIGSMAAGSPIPATFDIRFGAGALGDRTALPNSFSLRGKGQIHFSDQSVSISGKRTRPFWFGVPEEHLLASSEICDVRANGKIVIFGLKGSDTHKRLVSFAAASNEDAAAIAALLPTRQTEAFKHDQAERTDFQQRLDTLSPTAFVTPVLVALNTLMFLLMVFNGAGFLVPNGEVAAQWGSNFGPMTMSGQWWRLLTSTFIHFGVIHIAFNMFALYQTGVLVERMYGSIYFLVLYVFAGLSGSIVSILWHPSINSAGASGAIFGVFGGLLAFMLNSRTQVPRSIVIAHRNSTLGFIGYNLLNGFAHTGIDNGAHLGGLLGGVAMGFLLARPLEEAARRNPARRLAAAIATGALLLGSTIYILFPSREAARQDLAFQQALGAFASKETKALTDFDALVKGMKADASSQTSVPRVIEQTILPQWSDLHDSIAAIKLDGNSKRLALQQALLTYCDDRRKHLRLLTAALRSGDPELQRQTEMASKDVAAQIEIVAALIKTQ